MKPSAVIRLASGILRPLMPRQARPVLRAITALGAGVVEIATDGEWDDDDAEALGHAARAALVGLPGVTAYRADVIASAVVVVAEIVAAAARKPDANAPDPEDSADLPADAAHHLSLIARRRVREVRP